MSLFIKGTSLEKLGPGGKEFFPLTLSNRKPLYKYVEPDEMQCNAAFHQGLHCL